jgi:sugar phosphate isomerase/epimerase
MRIGVMAKTFVRAGLEEALDAVLLHGLDCVQFNMACVGLPPLPEQIDPSVTARIRRETEARGITLAAVSGTFNMIHPDFSVRRDGLRRLGTLAAACPAMGAPVITLCTGTRDPEDMWKRHPDNDSPEAWRDMLESLGEALRKTEPFGVTLAVEPEVANVIDSASKARRLLDELASPRLKIVIDPANLFHLGELPRMGEIVDEAFDLLGEDIVLAHAKDLSQDGEAGHEAAGQGVLDYDRYLMHLYRMQFRGPLILHGLSEDQVDDSISFLRGKMAKLAATL